MSLLDSSFCSFTGERSLSEESNIEMFFEIFPGLVVFIVQADVNGQNDWLSIFRLPTKAPYLVPNGFYTYIEEQKGAVSEFLDSRFRTWNDDRGNKT